MEGREGWRGNGWEGGMEGEWKGGTNGGGMTRREGPGPHHCSLHYYKSFEV